MNKINRIGSIKNNMIVYSLSIILLMTILSVYSLSIMERYKGQIETMFQKHIQLSELEESITRMDENLLGFLTTKSSTRLNRYFIEKTELSLMKYGQDEALTSMEDVYAKNISNLIEAYIVEADEAISYKRQRNVSKYHEKYDTGERIKSYIFEYIDELNEKQLNTNSNGYLNLVEQIQLLQMITYIIIIALIVLSFLVVYLITSRMVKPISNLSHAAEEISLGRYDTEDVMVDSEDELMVMADAFNRMKNSIRDHVDELKTKVETEAKLKDEQLKNVKMEHLLDNARLYALQSQINPHFLFNTINAGVQMSIMERAPKTGQFLETMSRLFRYNIQKMDSTCTLSEEIQNIKDYYELLKVRFGQRISFKFTIDPSTLDLKVPPLILQPLVENAYIHGLSALEEGGQITLTTLASTDYVYISVKDNGIGMEQALIDRILDKNQVHEGKGAGIGIRNVIDRIELFYHCEDLISIESTNEDGVKITIRIPEDSIVE